MKTKLIYLAFSLFIVINAFAQTCTQESAVKDVRIVPAKDHQPIEDQKPCDVVNRSSNRTITVKIEQSVLENNFLEKKIITVEKIGPNEQKFVGYAGCNESVSHNKCIGYKISAAYYEDTTPVLVQNVQTINTIDGPRLTAK